MKNTKLLFAVCALLTPPLYGVDALASGADILMRSAAPVGAQMGSGSAAGTSQSLQGVDTKQFQLSDAFLAQFFSQWQFEQRSLSYDVNVWVTHILKKDFVGASHLWSAVDRDLPSSFRMAADAAHIYCLQKISLAQTAFDYWVKKIAQPGFSESRVGMALEQVLGADLDRWVMENAILVSPEQGAILSRLDLSKSLFNATLRGLSALRKGDKAAEVLSALPVQSRLKLPLAQTAALAAAKKGDLATAARILKTHAEPAIEAAHDLGALSGHLLQIARFLYQAGALDEAEQYYDRIPNSSREFLQAREELTWILLRKGDLIRLRGEVATLSQKLFDDQFQPELHVVRAVSNLKLCFYSAVEKNFSEFQRIHQPWVKKIDAAITAAEAPQPGQSDQHTALAERRVKLLDEESRKLNELHQISVQAALPVVGFQSQWSKARDSILGTLEIARKSLNAEYRRQWKNQRTLLSEAIRKMQFVKVELMSQVRELSEIQAAQAQSQVSAVSGATDEIRLTSAAALQGEKDAIGFPFDGVIWPDELFRLRSVAEGVCLKQLQNHGGSR